MTTYDRIFRSTLRISLLTSAILFTSVASAVSASPSLCSDAPSIGLDETLRGEALQAEPDCYRLETPASGLLMFDLAVPGSAAAEPRLGILGPDCEKAARGLKVIEQSASHLLILSDAPGALAVCAGAQDPRQELGEYKLSTAFVELGLHKAEPIEVDPDPFSGCGYKAEPIEVDPDPFSACVGYKAEPIEVDPDPFSACGYKAEPIEVDPDPFTACGYKAEPIEVDPDPFVGSDPLDTLCRAQDDHSDSLLCATEVGLCGSVGGEIDNDWDDDHDVFVFELDATRTVRIETSGQVDTFGSLYDRRGQRLAATDTGGEDANFQLLRTLSAGVYFVRIEGSAGSRGAYELDVSAVERSW